MRIPMLLLLKPLRRHTDRGVGPGSGRSGGPWRATSRLGRARDSTPRPAHGSWEAQAGGTGQRLGTAVRVCSPGLDGAQKLSLIRIVNLRNRKISVKDNQVILKLMRNKNAGRIGCFRLR